MKNREHVSNLQGSNGNPEASHVVIPAKAGIQLLRKFAKGWIPAFPGMTGS